MRIRKVKRISKAVPTIEGAGVRLNRAFGFYNTEDYDPFLLLDDFRSDKPDDYLAGFPTHPHRGIQTVTYMMEGRVEHQDSLGNKGVIGPGGVQWMTSGSGIIHQEMPKGDAGGRMYGFQLWVNLPKGLKMSGPEYQEFAADQIPEIVESDGSIVKIICGEFSGVAGPVIVSGTDPAYIDLRLPPETEKIINVNSEDNVLLYIYRGELEFPFEDKPEYQGKIAKNRELVLLGEGDAIRIKSGDSGTGLLLISGLPLKEPVAWRGPIVMNTQKELDEAFEALENGTFLENN
ncbi:MAG: pirin family protein [Spirochaetales bacterium]|nr:pirin family protein [Spirochaetales bacterium]